MLDQEEYLISYANLNSSIFKHQKKFVSEKELYNFYKFEFYGIPQCLPKNIKYFDYSNASFFKIDRYEFSKKIFNTKNIEYIGNKKFFRYGSNFAYNVKLKNKYKNKYNFYLKNIISVKKKIARIEKKFNKVCSMQIRNVPHHGHEAVFKYILNNYDLLVLNPIFGIKKKNDFSNRFISKALGYMEKKYTNLKFIPFWTNFYYGGPREAMHHLSMREMLGFKNFYIGRDHAGAENNYKPKEAVSMVIKYKKRFKIKPFTSDGGYFCSKCNDYVIKGLCNHNMLLNISGTEFRKSLTENRLYKHADQKLQNILFKSYD
jgi:sulfate adenylyltransferase